MRAALISSFLAFAALTGSSAIAATTAPLPSIDMCSVDSSGYAEDLNDNGFVANLPKKIADGTVFCNRQTMSRLGTAGGRTYMLSQAWFSEPSYRDGDTATVAQVTEIVPDGQQKIVYRISEIDAYDAVKAKVLEQDGRTLLAIETPADRVLLRGDTGFAPVALETSLYEVSAKSVKTYLSSERVTEQNPEEAETGTFPAHFNIDSFSMDLPIAIASEVFPRTYTNPDYDRPLVMRFPLVLKDGVLSEGPGDVVEPEDNTPSGIGETPEFLSIPKDVTACEAYAWLVDDDPAGVAVRAAPSTKGTVIATLPAERKSADDLFGAEVSIIGSTDGWFLIENAVHPAENYGQDAEPAQGTGSNLVRRTYRGRGWVHGSRLATEIQSGEWLRASTAPMSKPVFDLKTTDENYVTVTGFKSCQGEAVELSVKRHDGVEGSGWIGGDDTSRLCSNQATTCS